MEIDISSFFNAACPRDYSASVAELGANARADTWRAAMDDAEDWPMLATDEARDAFRAFVLDSGGWSREEVAAFTHAELSALLIQWISGDMREGDIGPASSPEDWARYQRDAEEGRVSSRIFRADDGRVFFYVGN